MKLKWLWAQTRLHALCYFKNHLCRDIISRAVYRVENRIERILKYRWIESTKTDFINCTKYVTSKQYIFTFFYSLRFIWYKLIFLTFHFLWCVISKSETATSGNTEQPACLWRSKSKGHNSDKLYEKLRKLSLYLLTEFTVHITHD